MVGAKSRTPLFLLFYHEAHEGTRSFNKNFFFFMMNLKQTCRVGLGPPIKARDILISEAILIPGYYVSSSLSFLSILSQVVQLD